MTWFRSQVLLSALRVVLVGLIVLLIFAFYVQTRHGFRHVILPLMAKTLPRTFTIRDGYLRLRGSLALEGLHYGNEPSGVAVEAERVVVSLSLLSLIREQIPLVHELQIERATISLSTAEMKSAGSSEPTPSPPDTVPSITPLVVERGHVEDLTVVIRDDQRTFTAEEATLEFNQLGPGRHGTIGLRANLRLDQRHDENPSFASLTLDAAVEVNEAGTEARWTGSNVLRVRERPEGLSQAESGAIVIDQTFAGDYNHARRTLQASSSLTTSKGDGALGSAAVAVAMAHSQSARTVDASLTVHDVSGEILNVWLGSSSPARSYSGLINGEVFVHAIGPLYEVRSTLLGQQVQMRSEAGTTPPLDLSLKEEASFDVQSRLLLMKTLDLAVSHGTRSLLTGNLNRPVKVMFAHDQALTTVPSSGTAERASFTLRVQDVHVADLHAWTGLFSHQTAGDIRADPLRGTLNISIDEGETTVHLDGHFRVTNASFESANRASRVGPFSFEHEVRARLANLTRLELDRWTSVVTLKGKTVGEFRTAGSFQVTSPAGPLTVEGTFTLKELPGEALNSVIAFWKPTRVLGARFSGHATWKLADRRISWETDLRGRHVSLLPAQFPKATPPLDLAMAQSGTYNQTTGELRLVTSNVQAVDKGRVVLSAALSHPVRIQLSRGETQSAPTLPGSRPVTFTVEIDDLDVERLRGRLLAMGINAMETIRGGLMNGRLEARWQGNENKTAVSGELIATGLRFQRGTAQSVEPVSLTAHGSLAILAEARVELSDCRLTLSSARQEIATVSITGTTTMADGMTDLTIDASSGDLARLFDRLTLLDEQQRRRLAGGALKLKGQATRASSDRPLSVQASMQASQLRLGTGKSGSTTYSITGRGDIEIDRERTGVEIKQLRMMLESEGRQAGSATVTGRWPLTVTEQPAGAKPVPRGTVKILVKDWDGGPVADLFNLLPGRKRGPLPIYAEMTLEQDQASNMFTLRGRTSLGPIRVDRGDGAEEATLHLSHEMMLGNEEIRATSLTLMSERPHGSADRVTLSGVVRLGKQARTQLRSEVVSLDADWYADLLTVREDQKSSRQGSQVGGLDEHPGDPNEIDSLWAPRDFQAEVTIGTVLYRGMTIGPGRLIAQGTGNRLSATLEPTEIFHGKVQGELAILARDGVPEYSWTSKGQGLDVAMLQKAIEPGKEPRVTGLASFTTSGTTRGKGKELTGNASGTAVWDILNGRFVKAPLLAFLSKYTGLKGLEDMTFDRIRGQLRLGEGWIHISRVDVDGSLAKLAGQGKVRWDGLLEGRVTTKIGTALVEKVQIRCLTGLLKGADGLIALPVVVTAKGNVSAPEYSAELTREKTQSAVGSFSDLLRGCREDSSQQETTPAAAGQ